MLATLAHQSLVAIGYINCTLANAMLRLQCHLEAHERYVTQLHLLTQPISYTLVWPVYHHGYLYTCYVFALY